MGDPLRLARWLALALPLVMLAGAWGSQLIGGLAPCEMCHWQRWPYYAAIAPALAANLIPRPALQRALVLVAALLIIASGAIGAFHAGVEYQWWEGLTQCTAPVGNLTLDDIMNAPLIRCDVAPWKMLGISLAGYNALIALSGAGLILWLLARARRPV